jgi:flagellin-like protein
LKLNRRRGVSPVIAELLLIVITVAIGTLVYSFASTAFGGFGAGFSNLVQNAGGQLTENLVVEQVYFLHNSTVASYSCAGECTGDLFLGNSGSNTLIVNQIYFTNVTSSSPVSSPSNFKVFAFTPPGPLYSTLLPKLLIPGCTASCVVSIAPGQTVMVRFQTLDPLVAGTTYALTLVTARGNVIVAYQKA